MDRLVVWWWKNLRDIKRTIWWLIATLLLLIVGGFAMTNQEGDREFFMPGPSIDGHYQIESQCELCHEGFGGIRQKNCLDCHSEELVQVADSHGLKKFRDPRNTVDLDKINVKKCRVCHVDHKPARTREMGVTIAQDFCMHCHGDIDQERPTHKDLSDDSCGDCHNYHDNTDLNEGFLAKHLDEPHTLDAPVVPLRDYMAFYNRFGNKETGSLTANQHDAPKQFTRHHLAVEVWAKSSHAKSGVNCSDCHRNEKTSKWDDRVDIKSCKRCHSEQVKGFYESRHGMRLAQNLSAMTPYKGRLEMHDKNLHSSLGCESCHKSHEYTTDESVFEACVACHKDDHTIAYKNSKHYDLLMAERAGDIAEGSGVSCATCHFPREYRSEGDKQFVVVQHNQNANLRPRSKQIKSVCIHCHGLGFTLDALADDELAKNNYQGQPSVHLESLEMVKDRIESQKLKEH